MINEFKTFKNIYVFNDYGKQKEILKQKISEFKEGPVLKEYLSRFWYIITLETMFQIMMNIKFILCTTGESLFVET
jgi:hypothetical protein